MIIGMMFFSCRKKINIRESEEINFDLRTTSWARLPQQINPNAWEYRSSETGSKGDEVELRHTEYGFSTPNPMTYIRSQARYRKLDSRLEKSQLGMRTASNARNTHNFNRGAVFPGNPNTTVLGKGLLPAFPQYTPRWSSFYEASVLLCWVKKCLPVNPSKRVFVMSAEMYAIRASNLCKDTRQPSTVKADEFVIEASGTVELER
jgi:hypothetical protein